jgi:hypothetical protein
MGSNPLEQTAIHPGTPSDISLGRRKLDLSRCGFFALQLKLRGSVRRGDSAVFAVWGATREILDRLRGARSLMNLVVEASLPVCFDSRGNPKGRSLERQPFAPSQPLPTMATRNVYPMSASLCSWEYPSRTTLGCCLHTGKAAVVWDLLWNCPLMGCGDLGFAEMEIHET